MYRSHASVSDAATRRNGPNTGPLDRIQTGQQVLSAAHLPILGAPASHQQPVYPSHSTHSPRHVCPTPTVSKMRSSPDDYMSREELERKQLRRERNRLAAARCRSRRRETTEKLQCETEQLERDKSQLQKVVAALEKEKEELELVLQAHRPVCKLPDMTLINIKQEPQNDPPETEAKPKRISPPHTSHSPLTQGFNSCLSLRSVCGVFISRGVSPSHNNTSAGLTCPPLSVHSERISQPCGIAYRRGSSSSGDQSDHSLNSPTLLTL